MNRQEFLRQLEYLLRGISEQERMDALAYYNSYFDEAGIENEVQVIAELGSPEQVAASIIHDYYSNYGQQFHTYEETGYEEDAERYTYQNDKYEYYGQQSEKNNTITIPEKETRSKSKLIWWIILLVMTFPIWIGIAAGLFGGIVGLFGSLIGIFCGLFGAGIGLLAGGAVCFCVGIFKIFTMPLEGFTTIAVGSLLLAISVLIIWLLVSLTGIWIPKFVKWMIRLIKGVVYRLKGGEAI